MTTNQYTPDYHDHPGFPGLYHWAKWAEVRSASGTASGPPPFRFVFCLICGRYWKTEDAA